MQIQTYKVTLWFNISGSIPGIQTSHVTNLNINVKIMVCETNNVIMRSWPNDFDSDYMKISFFAVEVCVSRHGLANRNCHSAVSQDSRVSISKPILTYLQT